MMPRLDIRSQMGMLSIRSTPARMAPRQTRMQMKTESAPASFSGSGKLPKVKIDQTEAFASAGLKPVLRMANDFYDRSLQKGIEAIGQIVDEGLQFLRIEDPENPAPRIARENMENARRVDLTVVAMPSERPEIDVVDGESQLNWSPYKLNVSWERVAAFDGEFTPGEINITWLRRPTIEITLVPGSELYFPVNTAVGNNVDAST